MANTLSSNKITSQDKGAVRDKGLEYCHKQLVSLGWDVELPERKGQLLIARSKDGTRSIEIKVNASRTHTDVKIGSSLDVVTGDFWVLVNDVATSSPTAFVLPLQEAKERTAKDPRSRDNAGYWLTSRVYRQEQFREAWGQIGRGDNMPLADKKEEMAWRAWHKLTECAAQKETITYGELAAHLGTHHRPIRYVLDLIQQYCLAENLPPLTILVHNKTTGVLGSGFIAGDANNPQTSIENVWNHDWGSIENPFEYASDGVTTIDTIATSIAATPDSADEAFAKVKVRGTAQLVFRQALLKTYGGQCAFCGLKIEEALEAAHIIPWAEASPRQRLDPRNGVLLCATHHKLFDKGYMSIGSSGEILCSDRVKNRSPADKVIALDLHGVRARLPKQVIHQPDNEALRKHREKYGL
ncbi:MAG: HNH endonuclease [Rhodocyclaceae bacterium]|nr:HNH endonuclease [Rhodocyclaceae bacterium]